jgi:hypothetical protein
LYTDEIYGIIVWMSTCRHTNSEVRTQSNRH